MTISRRRETAGRFTGSPPASDAEITAHHPCHVCGYDLRAHPHDGRCPECGESVAESRRVAAIPRRPAWRDSDPRWRRRVLTGTWLLALLPLVAELKAFGWASAVPVPTVFDFRGTVRTLDDTLLCFPGVYEPLVFCTGVVLLFANERGRRRGRLDWTRRWGVICSYVVLLLSAAPILFIAALVLAGIAALAQSIALKYQPGATQFLVSVSTNYLYYGPQPKEIAVAVLAAFSSIAVLLACAPLLDALRSSGPKRIAVVLVAPLALCALAHLVQAVRDCLGPAHPIPMDVSRYRVFFWPGPLVGHFASWRDLARSALTPGVFLVEAVKWCAVLAIATWLTIAQLATWRRPADKPPTHAGFGA